MADGTRSKGSVDEQLKLHSKSIEELRSVMEANQRDNAWKIDDAAKKYDNLLQQMAHLTEEVRKSNSQKGTGNSSTSNLSSDLGHLNPNSNIDHRMRREMSHRIPKIDLPTFDGVGPREWVRKCEEYFVINDIEPSQQLRIAVIYLRGAADQWYGSWKLRFPLVNWNEFNLALCARFSSQTLSDMVGEFRDLKQTGTVEEYQRKFDELMIYMVQQNPTLCENFYVDCFIGGLSEELRSLVRVSEPQTLERALHVARAHESLVGHLVNRSRVSSKVSSYQSTSTGSRFSPFPSTKVHEKVREPISVSSQKLITPSQLQEKRAKGLCYRCDEKYSPGHKCKNQQLHFILADEEEVYGEIATEIDPTIARMSVDDPIVSSQLSFSSMSGQLNSSTIRVQGLLKKRPINILIDSGSSHTFLDITIAKELNCIVEATRPMMVTIADGTKMVSDMLCPNLPWTMQEYRFQHDVRLIKLGGCDMVIGVDWMKKYGPMTLDFEKLQMTFKRDGNEVTLRGHVESAQLKLISCKKFKNKFKKGTYGLFGCISRLEVTESSPTSALPQELQELLQEYQEVFDEPKDLPPTRQHEHKIELKDGVEPFKQRAYRYPHHQKEEIEKLIGQMLQQGVIRDSDSPFASPMLLVKKKDGTWRMCVDYRKLNELTIKDRYPIPIIDDLLDELGQAQWFTKIDLRSGFHQIRMREEDIHKTAFVTHSGHYEFRVMPFGLTNAPATFQKAMNNLLQPYLRKFVLVFFDDILVYSPDFTSHLVHLKIILELLKEHKYFAKPSKCSFAQHKVDYLGHVIQNGEVSADESKIQAIQDWPAPTNITELRGFLGLTGFYRRFVKGYGVVAKPLTELLKKDNFLWNPEAGAAFEELKRNLCRSPILALPNFSLPFCVETDACSRGIGAVLQQQGKPIAYLSKAFNTKELGLSIYEKELLGVIMAITKWKHYLQGSRFVIQTDQQSLKYLFDQKATTSLQQKGVTKLLGMDFTIEYKKGKENVVADALSRLPHTEGTSCAISEVVPAWIEQVLDSYNGDQWVAEKFSILLVDAQALPDYSLHQGILKYKGKICVGKTGELRQQILHQLHLGPVGGHSGINACYRRISELFFWPGLKTDIKEMVNSCLTCQQCKDSREAYPGLLQPLQIPTQAWQGISMDFVEGLPNSDGKTVIFVVVDRLTKYGHFIPMGSQYTAEIVAEVFFQQVFKYHGLPQNIVSDRDRIFTSNFWKHLMKLTGVQLSLSSAYHPQSDGQTERVNQCVELYLRCMCFLRPKQWSKWLTMAEFWYNSNYHTSLNMSPFEALYGYKPVSIPLGSFDAQQYPTVEAFLQQKQILAKELKDHLTYAQGRMKYFADQHRKDKNYNVGDMVFLKLQPYRQQSVALRSNAKLSPRFFGPYKIIAKVNSVAYKLQLPANSKVHPVFHVSMLKRYRGINDRVTNSLPITIADGQMLAYPEQILSIRTVKRHNAPVVQWKMKWLNLDAELSTWEDAEKIMYQFPEFPLP